MGNENIKIGIVTFAHPPVYGTTKEREEDALQEFNNLYGVLEDHGYELVNPLDKLREGKELKTYGISTPEDLDFCIEYFKNNSVDCLIINLCQWTRVALVTVLIKEMDTPVALHASTDNRWVGEVTATAVSGSVLEKPSSRNSLLLERFRDSERSDLIKWIKGVSALLLMKKSRLVSWGGQYGADIPYTRSDPAALENMFVKEIMAEQEICLIKKAKKILKDEPGRITSFIKWLESNNVKIRFDNKMLTEDSLGFQIAQYFAARDRLKELKGENISGVSIKCHFEISTECVGCTECLIAGFLPFGTDSEGNQKAVPVACEGDLNGLVSAVMLKTMNPEIPPLFGDMITYKNEYILLRNCGSASVYWAGRSNNARNTLSKVSLLPNMHGKSGCAVYFDTPKGDEITFARLFRANSQYYMYLGLGKVYEKKVENKLGITWPHTRISFNSDHYLIYKTSPCNHGCITEGDLTEEIEIFCKYAGVKVVRCDSDSSMKGFLKEISSP